VKDYVALPIAFILAAIFFVIMRAFAATYAWADTLINWQIFGCAELLVVMAGLAMTLKGRR